MPTVNVKFVWERAYDTGKNETYEGWSENEIVNDALTDIRTSAFEIDVNDLEIKVKN